MPVEIRKPFSLWGSGISIDYAEKSFTGYYEIKVDVRLRWCILSIRDKTLLSIWALIICDETRYELFGKQKKKKENKEQFYFSFNLYTKGV